VADLEVIDANRCDFSGERPTLAQILLIEGAVSRIEDQEVESFRRSYEVALRMLILRSRSSLLLFANLTFAPLRKVDSGFCYQKNKLLGVSQLNKNYTCLLSEVHFYFNYQHKDISFSFN